jgi:hypothetical protein
MGFFNHGRRAKTRALLPTPTTCGELTHAAAFNVPLASQTLEQSCEASHRIPASCSHRVTSALDSTTAAGGVADQHPAICSPRHVATSLVCLL